MRKLFWWSAGCLVAGAVAVTMAANHVSNHPDSWLGKCFIPAAHERAPSQTGVALAAAVEAAVAAAAQPGNQAMEGHAKLMAQPATEECAEAGPGPQFVEASEPIQVGAPGSPAGFNDSVPALPGGEIPVACGQAPAPGGQEECEPATPFMPPCPACEPEDKLYMPPCPEDEDDKKICIPYVDEDGDQKEEFSLPTSVWFHWLMKKDSAPKDAGKRQSEQLVPVTPGVAPETPEESEPMVPKNPPKCEEDPHYHYQYPGCPYMGGCPYGGHCTPEMKHEATPKLKKDKKKVKATPMSYSRKLRTFLDGGWEVKECHSDEIKLDTMECRPSDLKLAGLDPHEPF